MQYIIVYFYKKCAFFSSDILLLCNFGRCFEHCLGCVNGFASFSDSVGGITFPDAACGKSDTGRPVAVGHAL